MKNWLKYLIPGGNLEEEATKKVDKLEKEAEQELPRKVNKEVKRHYLLYILGLLLVLVLAGYFAVTYAKDTKETKKNQDLLQQQIDLQKKQLELQTKQIQDNKIQINATPTTTTPATTTTPKNTTPATPACDKTKQERQKKFYQALINKDYTKKVTAQSQLEVEKSKLTNPNLKDYEREFISGTIGNLTLAISDAEANSAQDKIGLDNVNNCKLYSEQSLIDWGKALGVTY